MTKVHKNILNVELNVKLTILSVEIATAINVTCNTSNRTINPLRIENLQHLRDLVNRNQSIRLLKGVFALTSADFIYNISHKLNFAKRTTPLAALSLKLCQSNNVFFYCKNVSFEE